MAAAWTKYRLSEQLQLQAFFTLIPHNNALKMLHTTDMGMPWNQTLLHKENRPYSSLWSCGRVACFGFCGCLPFSFAVFEANVVPRC